MKPRSTAVPIASDLAPAYAGLELLSTAVLVIDAEGRVRWVNQAAEAMLDLSRRIVQGQLARGLFAEPRVIDGLLVESSAGPFGTPRPTGCRRWWSACWPRTGRPAWWRI